jgi:hypothetical protein
VLRVDRMDDSELISTRRVKPIEVGVEHAKKAVVTVLQWRLVLVLQGTRSSNVKEQQQIRNNTLTFILSKHLIKAKII